MTKAIILCAGYATRLYPLTENFPKPLLKIGGKPLIEHLIEKIEEIPDINRIIIVSNNKFIKHFNNWRKSLKGNLVKIINDGSTTNENRLGALRDLQFALESEGVDEDMLVIAGDNLINFNLADFYACFQKNKNHTIAVYDVKGIEKVRNKHGVVLLDKNKRVIDFQEKPPEPKSTLKSICCYLFKPNIQPLLKQYLNQNNNYDASGFFIEWLIKQNPVYAFQFSEPVYDIGSLESYDEVRRIFE